MTPLEQNYIFAGLIGFTIGIVTAGVVYCIGLCRNNYCPECCTCLCGHVPPHEHPYYRQQQRERERLLDEDNSAENPDI
jgi:hypothetical protein